MSFTYNLIKQASLHKIAGIEQILTNGAVGATTGALIGGLTSYMKDKNLDEPDHPFLHRFYNPSINTFVRGAFRGGLAGGLSGLVSGTFANPKLKNIPGIVSGSTLGLLGGAFAPTDGEVEAISPLWDQIDEIEETRYFNPDGSIKQGSMTKEALGNTAKGKELIRKLLLRQTKTNKALQMLENSYYYRRLKDTGIISAIHDYPLMDKKVYSDTGTLERIFPEILKNRQLDSQRLVDKENVVGKIHDLFGGKVPKRLENRLKALSNIEHTSNVLGSGIQDNITSEQKAPINHLKECGQNELEEKIKYQNLSERHLMIQHMHQSFQLV
jgi:hypothetical protein